MTEGYSRIRSVRVADHFAKQREGKSSFNAHFLNANTDPIAAGVLNTQYMARSDLNWTDFIHVPKGDMTAFKNYKPKGGKTDDSGNIPVGNVPHQLKGTYRNGTYTPPNWSAPCPMDGGKRNGKPTNTNRDGKIYFYKGFDSADCFQFLEELGII